jgi:hypothetical protein
MLPFNLRQTPDVFGDNENLNTPMHPRLPVRRTASKTVPRPGCSRKLVCGGAPLWERKKMDIFKSPANISPYAGSAQDL